MKHHATCAATREDCENIGIVQRVAPEQHIPIDRFTRLMLGPQLPTGSHHGRSYRCPTVATAFRTCASRTPPTHLPQQPFCTAPREIPSCRRISRGHKMASQSATSDPRQSQTGASNEVRIFANSRDLVDRVLPVVCDRTNFKFVARYMPEGVVPDLEAPAPRTRQSTELLR